MKKKAEKKKRKKQEPQMTRLFFTRPDFFSFTSESKLTCSLDMKGRSVSMTCRESFRQRSRLLSRVAQRTREMSCRTWGDTPYSSQSPPFITHTTLTTTCTTHSPPHTTCIIYHLHMYFTHHYSSHISHSPPHSLSHTLFITTTHSPSCR